MNVSNDRINQNFRGKILILSIILLGASLRLFNVNWDQGSQLHPDERAIVLSVLELRYPTSFSALLTPESPWNPHFFAYGSLPIYLLKISADIGSNFYPNITKYEEINLLGRVFSGLFDLGTIYVLYRLSRKLFSETISLLAALLYALSVLPIQLSHFYAVDTLLTFFVLLTLYRLICFNEKQSFKNSLLIGVSLGLALTTKISALILFAPLTVTLFYTFLSFFPKTSRFSFELSPFISSTKKMSLHMVFMSLSIIVVIMFIQPYMLIDFKNFLDQTKQQAAMTTSAFTFPYTLQYVGKIPYLYELKNIFLWGLGPILGTLSILGTLFFLYRLLTGKINPKQVTGEVIIISFFLSYFLIVGKFAVGFMRYMLPLYPLFCLFAAVLALRFATSIKKHTVKYPLLFLIPYSLFTILLLVWPLSFLQIYTRNNTRVQASHWIYKHISPDKVLAVEHWDDRLPVKPNVFYPTETLALYDMDTPGKWEKINAQLKRTDYLIIASNRLYTPLSNLTNCETLPPASCYQMTAKYYQDLLTGKRGFNKVAEFTSFPTIPLLNLPLDDQSSDESFTVYDHPKVMIFKRQ